MRYKIEYNRNIQKYRIMKRAKWWQSWELLDDFYHDMLLHAKTRLAQHVQDSGQIDRNHWTLVGDVYDI